MWVLRLQRSKENEENVRKIWYICDRSKKYNIGRRQDNQDQPNSITLIGDKSVSRDHAIIQLDSDDQLHIEDLSSRYGTFFSTEDNSFERLPAKVKKLLSDGNLIRFGALNNIWKINRISFATCTSTCKLPNDTLAMLKYMCVSILPQWTEDCTHLTMSSITLTLKVLSALAAARPIVKPEFWKDCHNALQSNSELPDPRNYLPCVQEPTLNQQTANFHVDPSRKKVFVGKNFLFFSESQMGKYKDIIESACGTASLLQFSKMTKSQLCSPDFIIVQYMNEELSQDTQTLKSAFDEIVQYLKTKNFRVIPEPEIGLAILSVSLQKFCNPEFSFADEILKSPPNRIDLKNRDIEIFALETEPYSTSFQGSSKNVGSIISPFSNSSRQKNMNNGDLKTNECNEMRQNRKILRNCSPESDEPPSKKIASNFTLNVSKFTKKTNKIRENEEANEEMFNFENDSGKPENDSGKPENDSGKPKLDFNSSLNVKLNVKFNLNNKKKRSDSFKIDEDDNLFDFIPNESQESCKRSNNKLKKNSIADTDETPDRKRICLNKDSITDRKAFSIDSSQRINNTSNFTSLQSKLENTRWISSKNPSSISQIKQENIDQENKSIDDEFEQKMESLNIKPAIVVINNNLIKRRKSIDKSYDSSNEAKTNFKKFSKVQPLKPQSEVIPRSKFFIYEITTSNSSRQLRENTPEEDEYDFSLLDKDIRNVKTTSRRRF